MGDLRNLLAPKFIYLSAWLAYLFMSPGSRMPHYETEFDVSSAAAKYQSYCLSVFSVIMCI